MSASKFSNFARGRETQVSGFRPQVSEVPVLPCLLRVCMGLLIAALVLGIEALVVRGIYLALHSREAAWWIAVTFTAAALVVTLTLWLRWELAAGKEPSRDLSRHSAATPEAHQPRKSLLLRIRTWAIGWSCSGCNWATGHINPDKDIGLSDHFWWWVEGLFGSVFCIAYNNSYEEIASVWDGEIPPKYMSARQREFMASVREYFIIDASCQCGWTGFLDNAHGDNCPECGHSVNIEPWPPEDDEISYALGHKVEYQVKPTLRPEEIRNLQIRECTIRVECATCLHAHHARPQRQAIRGTGLYPFLPPGQTRRVSRHTT